ncbi:IQ domain-containing protein IQM3-like [Asparagus officinalis]|uniref:IQ domain-containing protein IQM3-like n=1 Tax=Asparagus officinalis TaxID=4686 RepID=UPI00098E58A8|nr:IQ domain-containing protein IQM3-like [Asparagus officinalis]
MESLEIPSPVAERLESTVAAATKVQKVYRSYRTRCRLADSAVIIEELWWQALEFATLNHSAVSFFNFLKPESAVSRWNRISLNASKVGQGLSKDSKALKLAFQHWIEAIDPRHRYGHNLHMYYEKWSEIIKNLLMKHGGAWLHGSLHQSLELCRLDIGAGRNVDLPECPRSLLRQQCIKYLGPKEREHYEYIPKEGKLVHRQTGELLDTDNTSEGAKWIFVMSTSKKIYAGRKKKGIFHHSSFLAGGTTLAAGRFTAENGVVKSIWAYSGHYKPSEENLNNFLTLLQENGVNLDEVQVCSSSNGDYYDDPKQDQAYMINYHYKRSLSGGLHSPRVDVPHEAILERIKSKREASSYQLGQQLAVKWGTGAGPRIGCVADYPIELRKQAMEFVNLSTTNDHSISFSSKFSLTSVCAGGEN